MLDDAYLDLTCEKATEARRVAAQYLEMGCCHRNAGGHLSNLDFLVFVTLGIIKALGSCSFDQVKARHLKFTSIQPFAGSSKLLWPLPFRQTSTFPPHFFRTFEAFSTGDGDLQT